MSSRSSIDEICIICNDSLRLQLDSDDNEEGTMDGNNDSEGYVYDDVELPCQHHLHYDCARDLHAQSRSAITKCPLCDTSLMTNGQILVTIRNEGGITTEFDLGQDLEEQRELSEHPELARNEAFLSFCFSGDHEAIRDLLKDGADVNAVQRHTGMNALHLCALNNDGASIRMLLEAGARRDVRGLDGSTALDLALNEGSHDAAYALQG